MNRAKFIKIVRHGRNLILHLKGQWYDKIEFEGKGIHLGTGNPEWGAPKEYVFIIKRGRRLK